MMHTAHTTDPQRAVSLFADALRARGRMKLLPKVRALLAREALRASKQPHAQIVVATADAEAAARKATGLEAAPVIVDETIVGGYQARVGDVFTDASFKKHLQDLYNRATA
ncbi:MAG: F0F1 ATP synthase subunit delta [Candidatus Pacebacteria bacterium]|nr:F0F1 ATP synthase subunit delta [Candidatus Paceibacterota bacterium]